MALLVEKLPEFAYDPQQSFRSWLKTVTVNRWRDHQRQRSLPVAEGADPLDLASPGQSHIFWETEYRQRLVARALEIMQAEFEEKTWRACWETTVAERSAADVARELGLSVGAVYIAKSRVLSRLREEMSQFLD